MIKPDPVVPPSSSPSIEAVDVFMSYARVDHQIADRIAASLIDADCNVWWDALLVPGDIFDEKIQEVVSTAKIIVGVLSPNSLASDWVRWELSQAITNGLHVIPILTKGVEPEDLAPPLSLVHAIVLPDLEEVGLGDCASHIRRAVDVVGQRASHRKGGDREARSRLAQAATETARRARTIKHKNQSRALNKTLASGPLEIGYSASSGLAKMLQAKNISLAITSPDADKLYLVGSDQNGDLSVSETDAEGATGISVSGDSFTVAARTALHTFENVLQPEHLYDGRFSHCFVARRSDFVGELGLHDIATAADGQMFFVSTRYSCIAKLSSVHSFQLVWKPDFVTQVVAEDRCHLNGLALVKGTPAFATACNESDTIDGWRANVNGGGVVIAIPSGEILCRGLSMPHSPRFHEDQLWLLNSGTGELGVLQTDACGTNRFEALASLPGFARGLAFHKDVAFVGLSRPRYDSFAGLDLHHRLGENSNGSRTGVAVINTLSGKCVEWFWLEGEAQEVYDVAVLSSVRCPTALPSHSDEAFGLITMEQVVRDS